MKLFGLEITRATKKKQLLPASSTWPGSIFGVINESFSGAWQQNVSVDNDANLLQNSAIYAAVTGIATDIAKMRMRLLRNVGGGVWIEDERSSPFAPVLKRPNHYQNRIEFAEWWFISKLIHGNTYALKQRDQRGVVVALYILDPLNVTPLVADDGSVFYELKRDNLSQVEEDAVRVPAAEVIHDTMTPLWHPLIGVSPLYACAMAGTMGNKIVQDSTNFFSNRSIPGGVLTAPGKISDATAARLKSGWKSNYGGSNVGDVAVLGDDLKFMPIRMTAEASQLAEQMGWTIEDIARAFHYPIHKLGGEAPAYAGSVDAANLGYYTDCLQNLIESFELAMDEGLGLPMDLRTECDLESLFRMDVKAIYETNEIGTRSGVLSPNEARARVSKGPVEGGESPLMQQQNYSLAALAERDANSPFATPPQEPVANEEPEEEEAEPEEERGLLPDEVYQSFMLSLKRDFQGSA